MSEKLRNSFSQNIEYHSETGDGFETKWLYTMDEKGNKVRKADGKINVYEQIQASAPSTDIHSILIRAANGEDNLLNVPNYGFVDTASMPLSEEQRINMVSEAKEAFEKMPDSIKAAFGSFGSFYKAVGDRTAEKIISEAVKKAEEAKAAAEVKKEGEE